MFSTSVVFLEGKTRAKAEGLPSSSLPACSRGSRPSSRSSKPSQPSAASPTEPSTRGPQPLPNRSSILELPPRARRRRINLSSNNNPRRLLKDLPFPLINSEPHPSSSNFPLPTLLLRRKPESLRVKEVTRRNKLKVKPNLLLREGWDRSSSSSRRRENLEDQRGFGLEIW